MIQLFNLHMKKIYIALLFVLIPAFTLYFVRGGNQSQTKIVGSMFGKNITESEFSDSYRAVYLEAAMRYGEYFKQLEKFLPLEQESWNRLLLLKKAKEMKLKVENSEVKDRILKMFAGGDAAKFDVAMYKRFIKESLRMTIPTFEGMIRNSILASKVKDEVVKDIAVSNAEVNKFFEDEQNKISFSYVKMNAHNFEKDVTVDQEKLSELFEKDKNRFTIPENIKLEYVTIKKERFKDEASVTDAEALQYYDDNKADYLIKEDDKKDSPVKESTEPSLDNQAAPSLNDDEDQEPALEYKDFDSVKGSIFLKLEKEKLNEKCDLFVDEVYKKMVEKNSFRDVVSKYDLEMASTDFFDKANPPKEIGVSMSSQVKDSFELALNDFCGPYDQHDGWLIVSVVAKNNAKVPETLDEVKNKVEAAYRALHAPELAKNKASEMRQKILGMLEKKTFEEAALELGEKSFVSGLISIKSQQIKGLGGNKELIRKAFELQEDEVSDIIDAGQNNFIFCQVSKREAPDKKILEKQMDAYKKKALEDKKRQAYTEWMEQLKISAKLVSFI